LSLTWYSIVLSTFAMTVGQFAKAENKLHAAILIDMLPGDNLNFRKNKKIVSSLIMSTQLKDLFDNATKTNEIVSIATAYGLTDEQNNDLKNHQTYVIMDWIVQSFNAKANFDNNRNLQNANEIEQLSELAKFLEKEDLIKTKSNFRIKF